MIEPVFVDVMRSCSRPISSASVRLVPDGRGHTAEQRRHLGAGEREAVDIVDEEQHIAGPHRRGSPRRSSGRSARRAAGTRRLVHLAVHHRDLRRAEVVLIDDAATRSSRRRSRCLRGCAHPRLRTPTGPSGRFAMLLISSIIVTVLPTPAPPNRPTLPPLRTGHIRSITLMPVSSSSCDGDSSSNLRRSAVDRQLPSRRHRAHSSIGRPEHVHDAAERLGADRDTRIGLPVLTTSSRGAGRRSCPERSCARQPSPSCCSTSSVESDLVHLEGVVDLAASRCARKLHVDDRADALNDGYPSSCCHIRILGGYRLTWFTQRAPTLPRRRRRFRPAPW